jgi:hypothetical protein
MVHVVTIEDMLVKYLKISKKGKGNPHGKL